MNFKLCTLIHPRLRNVLVRGTYWLHSSWLDPMMGYVGLVGLDTRDSDSARRHIFLSAMREVRDPTFFEIMYSLIPPFYAIYWSQVTLTRPDEWQKNEQKMTLGRNCYWEFSSSSFGSRINFHCPLLFGISTSGWLYMAVVSVVCIELFKQKISVCSYVFVNNIGLILGNFNNQIHSKCFIILSYFETFVQFIRLVFEPTQRKVFIVFVLGCVSLIYALNDLQFVISFQWYTSHVFFTSANG